VPINVTNCRSRNDVSIAVFASTVASDVSLRGPSPHSVLVALAKTNDEMKYRDKINALGLAMKALGMDKNKVKPTGSFNFTITPEEAKW
jgi:hypothetical protein